MLQVTLAGRLGRDAEVRMTPSGKSVCGFSVAVDVRKGQEKVTQWVDCTIWEKRGEALAPYLKKGQAVAITGELGVRQYEGKNGAGVAVECNVREITLQGSSQPGSQAPTTEQRAQVERSASTPAKPAAPPSDPEFNDDIPF